MQIKQNPNFMVDHRRFGEGLYISCIDGDITTFDMRTRRPNGGEYMDNLTMHSFEHMFSTYIMNTDLDVVYFGPMSSATGFCLLIRNADSGKVVTEIKNALSNIISHEGDIFGKSDIECSNYQNLSCDAAKVEAIRYLEILSSLAIDLKYY